MERELMEGMFWAGMLLSSIPLTLGIAVGIYAIRRLREPDGAEPGASGAAGASGATRAVGGANAPNADVVGPPSGRMPSTRERL